MPVYATTYFNMWTFDCSNTVYVEINPYTTVNNRQQRDAGLGLLQATRLLSGRGRVVVGVGEYRHKGGGFLQAKSQLGRSSYHVNLAFSSQSGQLDVRAGCLDRFICRQETSSVNQTGNKTETRTVQVIRCLCTSYCLDISCMFSDGCTLNIMQRDYKSG